MLRLILTIIVIATAGLSPRATAQGSGTQGAATAGDGSDLRRAVALIDYVSGDYPRAVSSTGALLSAQEMEEQKSFIDEAAKEVESGAGASGHDLALHLQALLKKMDARTPPAVLLPEAQEIRAELARRFRLALLPSRPPDLAQGKALFSVACARCHGANGQPPANIKAELELSTDPRVFAVPAEVNDMSPQRAFSAITFGVPGTPMPSWQEAYEEEQRWDLAFYVLSLSRPAPADLAHALQVASAAELPTSYRELAVTTDAVLEERLHSVQLSDSDRESAIAALRSGPFAESQDTAGGLAQARRALQEARGRMRQGDLEGARRAVISAYLDRFEPHEPSLRARDGEAVRQIEDAFLGLRVALEPPSGPGANGGADGSASSGNSAGANASTANVDSVNSRSAPANKSSTAALEATFDSLDAQLATIDAGGGKSARAVAFTAALAIALREGVEAALLVAALLALLRKANRSEDARAVHFGLWTALATGALTWFASGFLLTLGGAHRETTEGALQFFTAALLLWASHWLIAAASAKKLVGFLAQKTLSGASRGAIFALAFGSIYREAFEVVVFFRGLLVEAPGSGSAVAAGAGAGLICLLALVAAFQRLGKKLKPRPLLLVCGVLLCALSVVMVGKGVRAFQEAGLFPLTIWGGFQFPSLGLYASREGIVAQILVLAGLLGSAAWTLLRDHPNQAPPAPGSATGSAKGTPSGSAPASA